MTRPMLTVAEAAAILKKTPKAVLELIHAHRLAASDISLNPGSGRASWRIAADDLDKFVAGGANVPKPKRTRRQRPQSTDVKRYF